MRKNNSFNFNEKNQGKEDFQTPNGYNEFRNIDPNMGHFALKNVDNNRSFGSQFDNGSTFNLLNSNMNNTILRGININNMPNYEEKIVSNLLNNKVDINIQEKITKENMNSNINNSIKNNNNNINNQNFFNNENRYPPINLNQNNNSTNNNNIFRMNSCNPQNFNRNNNNFNSNYQNNCQNNGSQQMNYNRNNNGNMGSHNNNIQPMQVNYKINNNNWNNNVIYNQKYFNNNNIGNGNNFNNGFYNSCNDNINNKQNNRGFSPYPSNNNNIYSPQFPRSNSFDKFYFNQPEMINFEKNIHNEINKVKQYMKEGKISFNNSYIGNLRKGIENLKKQIPECDRRINFFSKNNVENYVLAAKRLKASINNVISDYEKFIK